ncbi:MAG: DUF3800 domain-containing protein [Alphaproteobacteria bacterium]|nr:DUF3800 domain-containing protein [Alphaproteobacteria bacterium]
MRVLYMDESGIGKIEHDRFLVVAGVIIHADTQWGPLANRLDQYLSEAVPRGAPKPRCLHAKDIFHGSGEFPRETWDQLRRNSLLSAIGGLVSEFNVPVVWSGIDRKEFARRFPDNTPRVNLLDAYTVGAVSCFMQTERYMREKHLAGEVCSILMEENKELQQRIPEMTAFMRDPGEAEQDLLPHWHEVMPLTKLIDNPSCQPKTGSSILQLADYCAFAIKRHLEGRAGSGRLVQPLAGDLMRYVDARKNKGKAIWNPVHMPSAWGAPIKYEDGVFRLAEG